MAKPTEWSGPWSRDDPEEVLDLLSIVDEGASGQVWKGLLKESKKLAAVKIIPLTEEVHGELVKETTMLKKCKYKYVTYYYGSYLKNGEVWIIMELCEGGSLHDMMHICTMTFQEEQVRAIAACMLLGLHFLKQQGIIHRDVKAKNVLISRAGTVKLADFGVAAETNALVTKRHTVIGSPHWMAPEVIVGEHDWQADIWSLGITLIELVESEPPMADVPPLEVIHRIVQDQPPAFKEPEKWSPKFHSFMSRCLVKDSMSRGTTEELLGHPFVAKYVKYLSERDHKKSIPILRKVVDENLPQLNWFREQEQAWRDEQVQQELEELEMQAAQQSDHIPAQEAPAPEVYRTTAKGKEHHQANADVLAAFDEALEGLLGAEAQDSGTPEQRKKSSPKELAVPPSQLETRVESLRLEPKPASTDPAVERKRQSYQGKRRSSKAKERGASRNSEPDPNMLSPTVLPKKHSRSKSSPRVKPKRSSKRPSKVGKGAKRASKTAVQPPAVPAPATPPPEEAAQEKSEEPLSEAEEEEEVNDSEGTKPAADPEAVRALQARLQALTAKYDQSISGLNSRFGYAADS